MAELRDFIAIAQRRAFHLEMRDTYPRSKDFLAWKAGARGEELDAFPWWQELVTGLVSRRGVDMRRVRVFSDPMAEYIRYEWDTWDYYHTSLGERLRWLPRQLASDLRFPGNDFWLVDDALQFSWFTGDGEFCGYERCEELDLVQFCLESFEAAWSRGIDHADYKPVPN